MNRIGPRGAGAARGVQAGAPGEQPVSAALSALEPGSHYRFQFLIKDVDGFKLSIGREDDGSVDLEAGSYTLYCDVAGHEAAGMVADLVVE